MFDPYVLLVLLITGVIYVIGKFIGAIYFGIHPDHVFLGFGEKPWVTFKIRQLTISLAFFVPLPMIGRFYAYHNGQKEKLKFEWEYEEKKLSGRMMATLSGVITCMLMAMVLFGIVHFFTETQYIPKSEIVKYGIYPSEVGKKYGFEPGDKILEVNGEDYQKFSELVDANVLRSDEIEYTVSRNGYRLHLYINSYDLLDELIKTNSGSLFSPIFPFSIGEVTPGSEAERIGLERGDRIVGVNDSTIAYFQQLRTQFSINSNDSVSLTINRNGELLSRRAWINDEGKLGFIINEELIHMQERNSLLSSISYGFNKPLETVISQITTLQIMLEGRPSDPVSAPLKGPIGIAKVFGGMNFIKFLNWWALALTLVFIYDLLPMYRTTTAKLIPIFTEALIGKTITLKFFKQLNLWLLLIMVFMFILSITSDLISSLF